jgi:hypothetical protein
VRISKVGHLQALLTEQREEPRTPEARAVIEAIQVHIGFSPQVYRALGEAMLLQRALTKNLINVNEWAKISDGGPVRTSLNASALISMYGVVDREREARGLSVSMVVLARPGGIIRVAEMSAPQ